MRQTEALRLLRERIDPVEFTDMLYQQLSGECEHCELSAEGFDGVMAYIAERIADYRDEEEAKEAK